MADTVRGTEEHGLTSTTRLLREEFNVLVAKWELLLAKLDDDAGVTDADYEATLGGANGPALVKDNGE